MGSVNYIQIEYKQAWLSGEFGQNYACKVFNITVEQLEALVGRYVRGKRVGMLRGQITWGKTVRGGWVKMGAYNREQMHGNGFVCPFSNMTFGHGVLDSTGKCVLGVDSNDSSTSTGDLIREAMLRTGRRAA